MSEQPASASRRAFEAIVKRPFVAARDLGTRLLERRHGIETAGRVELEELGLAGKDRVYYKPTEWLTLPRILPRSRVTDADVFVDFGSGLGRVVYQAANYQFRRVVGVELSDQLNAVARRNIERNRDRLRCQDVELVTTDVLDYEVPDDVTVAFFYNPFQGQTFATVIDRLVVSVDRRPRRLRIIYRNPVEHEILMATGRVRPVRRLRGFRPSREWSRSNSTRMYEVLPAPRP